MGRMLLNFMCLVVALPAWCADSSAPPLKPAWAFPLLGSAPPAPDPNPRKYRLDGSQLELNMAEIFDLFKAHDWFPESHPPMPHVVANGRKPEVRACGMCHYPNGQGRPENTSLAGQPEAYLIQQIKDYKSGLRRSSEPNAGPQIRMLATALASTDAEILEAARYFSRLTYRSWIRVVETDTVPKTEVVIGGMWAAAAAGGTEPLGQRIVEIPADEEKTRLRDPRSGFVAYVPKGSIARGAMIVKGGKGAAPACSSCHGEALRGTDKIPALAGRSPQYMARQIFDIKNGFRKGEGAAQMRPVVEHLDLADIIDALAYAASLNP